MSRPTGFVFVDDPRTFDAGSVRTSFVSHHIRDKRALFGTLKRQLELPSYFGWNWDALNDALQSREEPAALIHDGVPFGPGSPSRRIYLELLRGLAADANAASRWTLVFPTAAKSLVLSD